MHNVIDCLYTHTCISAYDKDQKLYRHLLFSTTSMKFPLMMYSKFVWASLIWSDRCLFWPGNVWWLATADIEITRLLASLYVTIAICLLWFEGVHINPAWICGWLRICHATRSMVDNVHQQRSHKVDITPGMKIIVGCQPFPE